MRTLATYLLFSGALAGLYAAVVGTLTHNSGRRVGLLEDSRRGGRDIYEAVCFDHEFDPLEGQP